MRTIAGRQRSSRTLARPDGPSQSYGLEKKLFGDELPRSEIQRRYYGKSMDMDRIETAIRRSMVGAMMDITDLGRESLQVDGHMTGLVQKRFNRSAAINWNVTASDGTGSGKADFDQGLAKSYAEFVARQLQRIPSFRERLTDLQWAVWDNRALLEIEWEVVSGRDVGDSKLAVGWRVKNLNWIHPRRLSFTRNRDLIVVDGVMQSGFETTQRGFMPAQIPEKFIGYTPRLFSDYAEREGLLLRAQYYSYMARASVRERMALMELFAAPWRLAYSDSPTPANEDSIKSSFRALQRMSSRNAAWLPPGVKAMFLQPGAASGQVHKDIIEDCRFVLSKMILGSTGSTDAVTTGLGSSIGDAMLNDQDLIIASDLLRLAEKIESALTDRIIELNYGLYALPYAPKYGFDLEILLNRGQEIANLKLAAESGLRIPLEQAYERTGYREPRENEAYLQWVQPPAEAGMPPGEGRVRTVYPVGQAPAPGDLSIEPEEALDLGGGNEPPALPPAAPPVPPVPPAPAPPPDPSKPPEAAPAAKPPAGAPDGEVKNSLAIEMPFEAPSGLTHEEREHHE